MFFSANLILGYLMGDSPCTLCWGQREQMAFIGVVALFMVRYGFKPKYLATMLVMAAVGLWSSFRHLGVHAARDVGQGFGLEIMGLHTQMWAEIVFWCVVMLFGHNAIRTSVIAAAIGLIVLCIFMIVSYRIPGVVATLALWIYTACAYNYIRIPVIPLRIIKNNLSLTKFL